MSNKRKQPESRALADSLAGPEHLLYEAIRSKQDVGIWTRHLKQETKLPDIVTNKAIKTLLTKKLIKEVVTIQDKGRKHLMAMEFEPSKEITGGAWYVDGSLDTSFIKDLKDICLRLIKSQKVATFEGIADTIMNRISQIPLSKQQIEEIMRALVLDNEVMEVKSTGTGEFAAIPVGKVCYICTVKRNVGSETKMTGGLASIPCGVCPRINRCTPDGAISPTTCVYYQKWLDF